MRMIATMALCQNFNSKVLYKTYPKASTFQTVDATNTEEETINIVPVKLKYPSRRPKRVWGSKTAVSITEVRMRAIDTKAMMMLTPK